MPKGSSMKTEIKVLIAVNVLILIFTACTLLRINYLKEHYALDGAASSWGNGSVKYTQESVYFSGSEGKSEVDAFMLRRQMEKTLKDQAALSDDAAGRQWIDCAYAETETSIYNGRVYTDVIATGVWGDYFVFHPEELLYGSYFSESDPNIDIIVLDDLASWNMFGSMDTVGREVLINGRNYRIRGVVRAPDIQDRIARTAYGVKPHVYVPYQAMKDFSPYSALSVYEYCIPEKVRDFGRIVAEEVFKTQYDKGNTVEQSKRFDLIELVKGVRDIPTTAMRISTFAYPWSENTVRAAELEARILAFPTALLLIITACSTVALMFAAAKGMGAIAKRIYAFFDAQREKRLKKLYAKTHPTVQ